MATLITRKEHDELPKLVGVPGLHSYLAQYRALVDAWEPVMMEMMKRECDEVYLRKIGIKHGAFTPCGECPPCRARKLMEEYDGD